MTKEQYEKVVNDVLKVVDQYELSREEILYVFSKSITRFDQLAIIPCKRKCSRSEREQIL